MLIQKDTEEKFVSAVRSRLSQSGISSVDVSGSWEESGVGLVRWIEDAGRASSAYVSVAVGNPSWQAFSECVVEMPCTVALFVRTELDPQGTVLTSVADALETLFAKWMYDSYQTTFTDLVSANCSVDGMSIGGGNSPTVTNGICGVSWSLTLSGHRKQD